MSGCASVLFFFFFQAEDGIRDVAVTGVQTCALPISRRPVLDRPDRNRRPRPAGPRSPRGRDRVAGPRRADRLVLALPDRKSTRLNSSHGYISYAVFCLKKKKENVLDAL